MQNPNQLFTWTLEEEFNRVVFLKRKEIQASLVPTEFKDSDTQDWKAG